MPNAQAIRSAPPAVGPLPAPKETKPGEILVSTAPGGTGHSRADQFRQTRVAQSVRIEQRLPPTPSWPDLSSMSTALRAQMGREPSRWTQPDSEAEAKLRRELVSYTRLADNWDGDGAKTPTQEAVNDALTFLDGRPSDIPPPYPEEGMDGDVGVYWDFKQAKIFAEVTFDGDGTFAYFAVRGAPGAVAEKRGNDGVDVAGPWPDDMLRILRIHDPA